MTTFNIQPGHLAVSYERACARLDQLGFADALWRTRLEVWSNDAAVQQKIAKRLGWLTALDLMRPQLSRVRACAESVQQAGFTHIVLLGMGGSSLAPEVLRQVLGTPGRVPSLIVLDSVDPDSVRSAMAHAATTLFIVASKSGSTIEPNTLAAEARRRVVAAGHAQWGSQFIAITDEGTVLRRGALADGFREVFVNPADIGGRYSALSLFGLVPAALMGLDLDKLLEGAQAMDARCRARDVRNNPGLALGALMAAGAMNGGDKLTLLLPPRLASFGLWIEQLVAESTGKDGTGVVPIAGESSKAVFGHDRVFVKVHIAGDERGSSIDVTPPAGAPTATLELPDLYALGGEFLRWEIATATAGVLMQINPFDEPNVQQAKDATRALLDVYQQRKQLPLPEPHGEISGTRLTLSDAAQTALSGQPAHAFLDVINGHDYFGLLAFLPPEDERFASALEEFRAAIAVRASCATMFGYGPRYLHSTGQLHKGGANNGVFVIVIADPSEDLAIPDQPFSFAVLETAQAIGDFQSLDRTGRRAMLLHMPRRDVDLFRRVTAALLE